MTTPEPRAPLSGATFGPPKAGRAALSGSTLGFGVPSAQAGASPVEDRYEDGGLLGRGGMGEVRAAHDPVLKRTVAIKVPHRGDRGASARLMGEAVLTAGLAHPGIPPIYDAGAGPDGRTWYTMPVIDGRSLAEVLADTHTLEERLRLLRHLIDAVDAVAYAHSRGVLHRDLKPANIMVGAFGRTLVVDWGVAGPVGIEGQASDGSSVGTPGFMAPEQQRGEPLGPAADVYALGATLWMLLRGEGAAEEELPPELCAIAARATAPSADDRYPDARSLAADLTAWSEGRRVTAHRYTLAELARRAWATSRGTILATAAALIGVAAATAIGVERTAMQRDRATAAERQAVAALVKAEESLAAAQLAQALSALRDGDRASAEIRAATSLTRVASPEAHGVLAAFDPATRPRLIRRWPLPEAREVYLSLDGASVVFSAPRDGGGESSVSWSILTLGDEARVEPLGDLTAVKPFGTRGRVAGLLGDDIMVREPGGSLRRVGTTAGAPYNVPRNPLEGLVVWVATGDPKVIDLETGRTWDVPLCAGVRSGAFPEVRADGHLLVACADGQIERAAVHEGAPIEIVLRVEAPADRAVATGRAQHPEDPSSFYTPSGAVVVYDPDKRAVLRTIESGPVSWKPETLAGERLVVRGSDGGARVFDWPSGVEVAGIPVGLGDSVLLDGGRRVRFVSDAVEDWLLPEGVPASGRWESSSGITSIDVSPTGPYFATAHGDGHVRIGRFDRPGWVAEHLLSDRVVKDVTFSPDGTRLAAAFAMLQEVAVIELARPDEVRWLPGERAARIMWLPSGLYLAPYADGLLYWPEPVVGAPEPIMGLSRAIEMTPTRDRTAGFVVPTAGPTLALHDGSPPWLEPLEAPPRAHSIGGDLRESVGLSLGGFTLMRDGVEVGSGSGVSITWLRVAVSPDGRRFALGRDDGGVEVWSVEPLRQLAVLRGHTQQIGGLAFDQTGQWLLSGSWDGDVMRWSLASLDADPAVQLAEIEADWGRTAAEVLRGAP